MSTPRSRRRSRLRQSSKPPLTPNISKTKLSRQPQDASCEFAPVSGIPDSPFQDAGHNEKVERSIQDTQARRSRRRSRQLRSNNHHATSNDHEGNVLGRGMDEGVDTTVPYTSGSPEQGIKEKADDTHENTSSPHANEANLTCKNDDLQMQSSPEIYVADDKDVYCSSSEETYISQEVDDDDIANIENCEPLSLSGDLREVCKGLSKTATKTFVQYFDTIKRKEEENETIRQRLDEEQNRRRFDKCMQQLNRIRGECALNGIKKGFEDYVVKKEDDIRSISNRLLVEKQRQLLAKCLVEIGDRRRRVEVKRLKEIVTQESLKRKELEAKLKSLLPEIKVLKSLVDLTGDTSKETRDDEMATLRTEHQDLTSKLDRTSKLLVHTKAQLFDIVNVYQQTNKKVVDLEAAIFKARETARDLFDRGSTILEKKSMARKSASANSDPEPNDKNASMLLNFTQNATWLAGLLASELPLPWQGPHRSLGQRTDSIHYDPTGLCSAKQERQGSSGRRSQKDVDDRRPLRSSKINSLTRVNSRSSGSLLKNKKLRGLYDDSDLLFSSKSTNQLSFRSINV